VPYKQDTLSLCPRRRTRKGVRKGRKLQRLLLLLLHSRKGGRKPPSAQLLHRRRRRRKGGREGPESCPLLH